MWKLTVMEKTVNSKLQTGIGNITPNETTEKILSMQKDLLNNTYDEI